LDYKAKVKVVEKDDYFIFEFAGFDISGSALARMHTSGPQVKSVRFLDLPMKECENFGQWLNVVWDDKTASAVVALEPFAWIGNEKRYDARHLYAETHKDVKLDGVRSALVVSEGKAFLDCMDVMEKAGRCEANFKNDYFKRDRWALPLHPEKSPEGVNPYREAYLDEHYPGIRENEYKKPE
jgi:hypothetical protein